METFTRLLPAGPLFFVSAWVLMLFAGIAGTDVGVHPFGYGETVARPGGGALAQYRG
jgi:hypothetical protein